MKQTLHEPGNPHNLVGRSAYLPGFCIQRFTQFNRAVEYFDPQTSNLKSSPNSSMLVNHMEWATENGHWNQLKMIISNYKSSLSPYPHQWPENTHPSNVLAGRFCKIENESYPRSKVKRHNSFKLNSFCRSKEQAENQWVTPVIQQYGTVDGRDLTEIIFNSKLCIIKTVCWRSGNITSEPNIESENSRYFCWYCCTFFSSYVFRT